MGVLSSIRKVWNRSSGRLRSIRLIVSDIDGTLLNSDGDMFDSTVQLIRELRSLGVGFMLATGRTHHTAVEVYHLLGMEESCIAFDGAVITSIDESKLVVDRISSETRAVIAEQCALTDLSITSIDMNCYTTFGKPYSPDHLHHENIDLKAVDSMREVFVDPAFRYYGVGSRASVEMLERTLSHLEPTLSVHARESHRLAGSSIIEIRQRQCDKGTALRRAITMRGIHPKEVAVIGDYRNDLPMFEKDYFCVALSNAVAELRSKADLVTEHDSDNAGIDQLLEAVYSVQKEAR